MHTQVIVKWNDEHIQRLRDEADVARLVRETRRTSHDPDASGSRTRIGSRRLVIGGSMPSR